jgi:hypothetical protein
MTPFSVIAEVTGEYIYPTTEKETEESDIFKVGEPNSSSYSPLSPSSSHYYINNAKDFTATSGVIAPDDELSLTTKGHQYWSNRSIRTAGYIAVNTGTHGGDGDVDSVEDNYRLAITNLYNANPDIGIFSLLSHYSSIYGLNFYKISNYISLFDVNKNITLSNTYTCYKGDCFLQRFYFKQMYWDCTPFQGKGDHGVGGGGDTLACNYIDQQGNGPVFDDPPETDVAKNWLNRYPHGLIMGIVVEMKYNGNMRYKDGDYNYYPNVDAYTWNINPYNTSGIESWWYNFGHHRILDEISYSAFNSSVPLPTNIHPTRIRYSDKHDQYSIIDGYRNVMPYNYKDYDSSYNQIQKIYELNDELVSVQEDCINRHYILEKDVTADITSGEIAMGSGDVLSQSINKIADYGTKHQWSVLKTGNNIYGVDALRRLIWRVKLMTSGTGKVYPGAEELNRIKSVEKWVYDWFDYIDERTDIMSNIPDTPLLGYGISTGYHPKYKDVIFTFLDHGLEEGDYTISSLQEYNSTWIITENYYLYSIIYNSTDENWYYSKLVDSVTGYNTGHKPELSPTWWSLIDFSNVKDFEAGMTVEIGDVVRCCYTDSDISDCGTGFLVVVTYVPETIKTCSDLYMPQERGN